MSKQKMVTVLIPAYNEQDVLPRFITQIKAFADTVKNIDLEFLFVNDGSHDRTLEIISDFARTDERVSYINFSRNFGKEIAMIAGLDYAQGDAVVIIDADLQDPPHLIGEMISLWQKGYDDVYAKRRSREGESWLKTTTSKLYYRLLKKVTRVEVQEDTGDFRLLDRRMVEALREYRESQRNAKALFSLVGFKKKEILYDRDPRAAGETKWSYPKLFGLAIDGITSFTTAPLRIASLFGVALSVIAAIYILYLLVRPMFGVSTGNGYSSLMAVILFLGGVQLLSLGIIGEYIARIFNETKRRPLYLIEKYHERKPTKTHR